jgi:hypothetical protein
MENTLAVIEPAAVVTDGYNEPPQLLLPLPGDRGWKLPNHLTFEQWMEAGKYLTRAADAIDFARADFIEFGRNKFGDERVKEALQQLEFPAPDFKKAQLLAGITLRDSALSPEHHFILAKADPGTDRPTPEHWGKMSPTEKSEWENNWRTQWAELAKLEKLTAADLQESINRHTVTRIEKNTGDGNAGVSTWNGLVVQFGLMKRAVKDTWLTWNEAEIDTVLAMLQPIVAFVVDLQFRKRQLAADAKAIRTV